jgi:hypothetical protein
MTPKEKAEDLVKSFIFEQTEEPAIAYVIVKRAKECALITVDEILEIVPKNTEQIKYSDGTYAREYREIPNRYWTEVKQEINKL